MIGREGYETFLAEVRKTTGLECLVPDEGGLASVRVDDAYNLNFQFVEATGKILCFIEVVQLPVDADKAVYRDLLAGGLFGKMTAGGYFALEPDTETVVYNYLFDLEGLEPGDFTETLEKILQLCDMWVERIRSLASGAPDEPAADPDLHKPGSEVRLMP